MGHLETRGCEGGAEEITGRSASHLHRKKTMILTHMAPTNRGQEILILYPTPTGCQGSETKREEPGGGGKNTFKA